MQSKARGVTEMTSAMLISGTIGWVVVQSGEPAMSVVFWRCVFGAATAFPDGFTMSRRFPGPINAFGEVIPQMNWDGSAATMEVVVVLPCVPATATVLFSRNSSASISARRTTGTRPR